MPWCSCDHKNSYEPLSNINMDGINGSIVCYGCGDAINQQDIVILLLEETKRLQNAVTELEREKGRRDKLEVDQEFKKMEEDQKFLDQMDKDTERFDILDL